MRNDSKVLPAVYRRAIGLSVLLFCFFTVTTALYAQYGYAFALFVYEKQQRSTAEDREGLHAVVALNDYLLVNPDSLAMRGLLVNAAIAISHYDRALLAAEEGLEKCTVQERPYALLLLGRATLASGELDRAESVFSEVLRFMPRSREAHYGLAHVYAAQGHYPKVLEHFAQVRTGLESESTEEFKKLLGQADETVGGCSSTVALTLTESEKLQCVESYLVTGALEDALSILDSIGNLDDAPRQIVFWNGVANERAGKTVEAMRNYRQANALNDRLAKFALRRLETTNTVD